MFLKPPKCWEYRLVPLMFSITYLINLSIATKIAWYLNIFVIYVITSGLPMMLDLSCLFMSGITHTTFYTWALSWPISNWSPLRSYLPSHVFHTLVSFMHWILFSHCSVLFPVLPYIHLLYSRCKDPQKHHASRFLFQGSENIGLLWNSEPFNNLLDTTSKQGARQK